MQKINKFIADNGIWIFLCAATYRFTFYIINLVSAFKASAGYGVKSLFGDLFDAAWGLIILAVILEVSRKVASGYPPVQQIQQVPGSPYTAQRPVQPVQPPVQQPAQPAQPQAIWTCPNCGSQNSEGMAFCAKCGKQR